MEQRKKKTASDPFTAFIACTHSAFNTYILLSHIEIVVPLICWLILLLISSRSVSWSVYGCQFPKDNHLQQKLKQERKEAADLHGNTIPTDLMGMKKEKEWQRKEAIERFS